MRRHRFLSYPYLVSTAALVVALTGGGAAIAAVKIHTADIVDGAVTTPKLHSGAVTSGKLAARSVTSGKLAPLPQERLSFQPGNPGVSVPANDNSVTIQFNHTDFGASLWTANPDGSLSVKRSGTYLIQAVGVWQPGSGTERNLCIAVFTASDTFKENSCHRDVPNAGWTQSVHLPLLTQLTAGDRLNMSAQQDSPVSVGLLGPELTAVYLGPSS